MKKLDIWEKADRDKILKKACPFCGQKNTLDFAQAMGYESHFADSEIYCRNCGFSVCIRALFNKTEREIDLEMRKLVKKQVKWLEERRDKLLMEAREIEERLSFLKEYNPSRR